MFIVGTDSGNDADIHVIKVKCKLAVVSNSHHLWDPSSNMLILAHGVVSSTVFSFHHFFLKFVIVQNLSLKEETALNFFYQLKMKTFVLMFPVRLKQVLKLRTVCTKSTD